MKKSDSTASGGHSDNATKSRASRDSAGSDCARPKKMKRINLHIPWDLYLDLCEDLSCLSPKQAVKLLLEYAELGRLARAEHKRNR